MEYQGYSTKQISDAITTLQLEAQTFDEVSQSFTAKGVDTCTYGEFITVSITVEGDVDIPSFLFVDQVQETLALEVEKTSRCWRA